MDEKAAVIDLGIASRLTRSQGRTGRDQNANARLTLAELKEVKAAARAQGKALGEWSRDVLLAEARSGGEDRAVFTELIALRLLVNNVLRTIALGQTMTEKEYAQVLAEVKNGKRTTAAEILIQYRNSEGVQ